MINFRAEAKSRVEGARTFWRDRRTRIPSPEAIPNGVWLAIDDLHLVGKFAQTVNIAQPGHMVDAMRNDLYSHFRSIWGKDRLSIVSAERVHEGMQTIASKLTARYPDSMVLTLDPDYLPGAPCLQINRLVDTNGQKLG